MYKKIVSSLIICLVMVSMAVAQAKVTDLDKSPLDISYWPTNYPVLKLNGKTKELPVARVVYSRPQKNNRTIFSGIVKYGEMWRLGANEATEIEFFKPVKIAGKLIAKGRYTLYCIPDSTKWTIIFSKDNFSWGNYSYNAKNDVLRTDIKVEKSVDIAEPFTIYFDATKTGANLVFWWDDVKTTLPIAG